LDCCISVSNRWTQERFVIRMTPMSRPVTTCEIRQNFKFYLIFFERAARETWKAKLPVSCCLYV
jgi:hypothetical protein